MPPCRQCGARVDPCRARPVPFWRHGFWLPPVTKRRVLVACVPWRWFERNVTTARCMTSSFTVPSNSVSGRRTFFFLAPAAEKCGASIMATPAPLLAHREEAVHRPGDRAPDEQQVARRIDLDHPETHLREAARAHVPGHALALDDARRIGARSDGARLAVPGVAVRLGTAAEMMAMHHALEPAPLRDAGDLDAIAGREDRDRHGLAQLGRLAPRLPFRARREAPQHAGNGREPRGLHVPDEGLGAARGLAGAEPELHLALAHLNDRARPGFDHRDGHVRPVLAEQARHAELSADQCVHDSLTRP